MRFFVWSLTVLTFTHRQTTGGGVGEFRIPPFFSVVEDMGGGGGRRAFRIQFVTDREPNVNGYKLFIESHTHTVHIHAHTQTHTHTNTHT